MHYSIAWDTAQNASSEQHNQTISNPTQAARSVFGAMKWSWNMRECLNLPQTTGSRDPVGVAHPSLRNKRTKERASERNQPTNKSTHPRTHSPSPCDYAPTHPRTFACTTQLRTGLGSPGLPRPSFACEAAIAAAVAIAIAVAVEIAAAAPAAAAVAALAPAAATSAPIFEGLQNLQRGMA